MISFNVSKEEGDLIIKIAWRADAELFKPQRIDQNVLATSMDLTAIIAQGCPLRLRDLLMSNEVDFAHDIFGIRKNLNRTTGKLENHFTPRFAKEKL